MTNTQRLRERIADIDRAAIRSLSTADLERIAADSPSWMRELPDADLELIANGGPLPARLRRLLADAGSGI